MPDTDVKLTLTFAELSELFARMQSRIDEIGPERAHRAAKRAFRGRAEIPRLVEIDSTETPTIRARPTKALLRLADALDAA